MISRRVTRAAGGVLTLFGVVAIIAATITPSGHSGTDGPPWCMSCPVFTDRAGVDIALNVLLYAPIGVGLALLRRAPRHIGVLAFVIAAVIETLQADIIPGRFASITDVIANTAGALLGASAVRHGPALVAPTPARSRTFAFVAAALTLSLLHVTMWAQRELPVTGRMSTRVWPAPATDQNGVAAHGAASHVAYLRLNGRPYADKSALSPNEIERLARSASYRIEMGFVPSSRPGDEDPAVELRDGDGRRRLRVRQDGRYLAAELTTQARMFRLRMPTVRLRFLPSREERYRNPRPETVHVSVRVERGDVSLRARVGDREATAEHRHAAFAGWSMLLSQRNSPRRVRILTFLWVLALLGPPVYWAVLSMPRSRDGSSAARAVPRGRSSSLYVAAFCVVLLALALEVVPRLNGMAPAGLLEGSAAAVALGLGSFLALFTSRRRTLARAATVA